MRALGIDVSASRGLDLVLLDQEFGIAATYRRIEPTDLAPIVAEHRPDVIAIDAPPAWGTSGGSRMTERELRRFGIQSFGTPSDPKKADGAFYDWMRVGMATFEQVAATHPRYRSGSAKGTAMEVFPHATAVVLAECLPPTTATKRAWRERVLRGHHVAAEQLRSIDQVDAALAALTGLMALRGRFTALGDPKEGVIVLPARTLPATTYRRCIEEPEPDEQPHLPGLAFCRCGDPGCTQLTRSEFAPGHDAKRKSFLWKQTRIGAEAVEELRRRKWELPPEVR